MLFDAIDAGHSSAALKWYKDFRAAILSLKEHPNHCPETPENTKLRRLLYGHKPHVYRVIYRVAEKSNRVDILRIRHAARQAFKLSDIN